MHTNVRTRDQVHKETAAAAEKIAAASRISSRRLVSVDAAGETFLPARRVWERYGISEMTLFRWVKNPDIGFPAPMYIGRFRYWRLSDLVAFEARDGG